MFVIIWRRSGLAVLFYIGISFWIVGNWYKNHSDSNPAYVGWSLFYAALVTLIHALILIKGRYGTFEGNSSAPVEEQEQEQASRESIWSHSLFFIPVVIWPFILGGFSGYKLLADEKKDKDVSHYTAPPKKPVVERRNFHMLNPTNDTLVFRISGPKGVFEKKSVSPHSYVTTEYFPGAYRITGFDHGDIINIFPSDELTSDKNKCVNVKNNVGDRLFYRIVKEATPSPDDYDDIWVVLGGKHNMLLVDVSEICSANRNEKLIRSIDWTKHIEQTYDGHDLVEPLYGKDPGKGIYTMLGTGGDIPLKLKRNERVFALLSVPVDQKKMSEFVAQRILYRCPEIPE
jgi:hypothetical protein